MSFFGAIPRDYSLLAGGGSGRPPSRGSLFGGTADVGPAPSGGDGAVFPGSFLVGAAIGGALLQAVGAFFTASSERNVIKSRALSADHEASMANLNARQAELDAQAVLESGRHEIGLRTLAYGQEAGAQRAALGGAGAQVGVGSAAEVAASIQLAKQVDTLTITKNSVRAAGQARMRAAEMAGRSLLARASGRNLRAAAGSIKPWLSAGTSLLTSVGQSAGSMFPGGR